MTKKLWILIFCIIGLLLISPISAKEVIAKVDDKGLLIDDHRDLFMGTLHTCYSEITVNNEEYDLTEFCKELDTYHKENKNINNYLQKLLPLELDSNTYLYITDLTLEYNKNHLSLKGYILYK